MNFSTITTRRTLAPKFLNLEKSVLAHHEYIHLKKLDIVMEVFFTTRQLEELEVKEANYYTDYRGAYLGVIDAFFELIQHRPLEAIDRFPIKELDFFLRDDPQISAFSGYNQELYEILSIGESLKAKIFGEKKKSFTYDEKKEGSFFNLSYAEQLDWMEEFFAYYVYDKDFPQDLEFLGCESRTLFFNQLHPELFALISEVFGFKSDINFKVKN